VNAHDKVNERVAIDVTPVTPGRHRVAVRPSWAGGLRLA